MSTASGSGGLDGRDASETKIMHFEKVQTVINHLWGSGLLEIFDDDVLHLAALGADCCRVPGLNKQGFQVIGKPEALWISVFHSEKHVFVRQHRALWHSFDADWQVASMMGRDVLPCLTIEQLVIVAPLRMREVDLEVFLRGIDLVHRHHWSCHVFLDVVLQTEEAHFRKLAASALEVRVDLLGARRVLQVVGHLVGVC